MAAEILGYKPATGETRSPAFNIGGFGDSITSNAVEDSSPLTTRPRGFLAWLPVLTNQRVQFNPAHDFGVGGNTTAMMLARIDAVLAAGLNIVTVMAGTNDGFLDVPSSETITNLDAIYSRLQRAGIYVVAIKILPRSNMSTAQRGAMYTVNRWIERQRYSRRNFFVVDAGLAFIDPATGLPKDGYTYDTAGVRLHPTATGAYQIAKLIQPVIEALAPPPVVAFSDRFDVYNAASNPGGNHLVNGLMEGTAGVISNGPTGTLATSFSCNGSARPAGVAVALSKVNKADGRVFQRVDLSGSYTAATGSSVLNVQALGVPANLSAGDYIYAEAEIEWDATLANVCNPYLTCSLTGYTSAGCLMPVNTDPCPPVNGRGLFRSAPFIVPPGAVTTVAVQISALFIGATGETRNVAGGYQFGSVRLAKAA